MENQTTQKEPATVTFTRRDIHQQVTDTIIQQLESGTVPWQKPWTGNYNHQFDIPKNFTTDKKYRGINILLLWSSAITYDFPIQEWGTFKQWQGKKETIRKGEKGSMIVYYDTMEKEIDGETKKIPFLKSSVVFNRCQLTNYQPEEKPQPKETHDMLEDTYAVDDFINNTQAKIISGHEACYVPKDDTIIMPGSETFITTDDCPGLDRYFGTLLHELTHWTGAEHRLNRSMVTKFGTDKYAQEELVAELGSAFLCAENDIAAPQSNNASYISHWLKVLKENKHCIISAASEASKAVDYLYDLQP